MNADIESNPLMAREAAVVGFEIEEHFTPNEFKSPEELVAEVEERFGCPFAFLDLGKSVVDLDL